MADEQPGAPSAPEITPTAPSAPVVTALDRAVASGDMGALREARRVERATPSASPTASPAVAPAEQAPLTEGSSAPGSVPGTPRKKNADTRVQELLQERAQLRAQLEAASRPAVAPVPDVTRAASSPAPVPIETDFPEYESWIATAPEDRNTFERYLDARSRHVYRQEQAAVRAEQEQAQRQRSHVEQVTAYRGAVEGFMATAPDYWDVVTPILEVTLPTALQEALGEALTVSPIAPQILYHLGQHPDEFQRLIALPERQALVALGRIEASLPASTAATPKARAVISAHEPPTTLGRRPAGEADELVSAVASGDMGRFKALRQRDRLAATR